MGDCGCNGNSGEKVGCHYEAFDNQKERLDQFFEGLLEKLDDNDDPLEEMNIGVLEALSDFVGRLKQNIDAQVEFTDPKVMECCQGIVDAAITMALVEQVASRY